MTTSLMQRMVIGGAVGFIGIAGTIWLVSLTKAQEPSPVAPEVTATTIPSNSPVAGGPENAEKPCRSTGIRAEGVTGLTMDNNQISGADCAIDVRNSKDVSAHGNIINPPSSK